jgi:predicted metal-dependent enzyme (double-stranded beta helix superfamily)
MDQSLAVVERPRSAQRSALVSLVAAVEAACEGPMDQLRESMLEALARAARAPGLLTPRQRQGNADRYVRHLLHGDARGRFAVVSIVWQPGQRTPVHGHYTWCGYAVVEGSLHEDSYQWTPGCAAVSCSARDERRAGYTCFGHAGVETIHRLGNQARQPATSVHVYGVDAPRIATHVNRVLAAAD